MEVAAEAPVAAEAADQEWEAVVAAAAELVQS